MIDDSIAPLRIAIAGAGGRMGRALVSAVIAEPGCSLAGAFESPGHSGIGADPGVLAGLEPTGLSIVPGINALAETAETPPDAVIDFTVPEASCAHAEHIAAHGGVHVIGTKGFSPEQEEALASAAERSVIVKSGNMSLGVNLVAALVKTVAKSLGEDWDIEVLEMHHRHKVDAPSGTALMFGDAAASGRGVDLAARSARGRDGHTGERKTGDIGFAVMRGGSVVGDHTVIFAGDRERVSLSHHAEDR
ncbi:MAG: 4-hydroxy-tetrahydrodipicolinate reductase, partial [Pseudomonadota bacterium]